MENNSKRNLMTYLKLPPISKASVNDNVSKIVKAGSNFFGSNEYKNQVKHNLSNQSLEIQINTQYSKNNKKYEQENERIKEKLC